MAAELDCSKADELERLKAEVMDEDLEMVLVGNMVAGTVAQLVFEMVVLKEEN